MDASTSQGTARSLRALIIAIGAVVVLAVLSACSGRSGDLNVDRAAVPVTASTVAPGSIGERIAERGKVVIGVKFDVPLFGVRDAATGAIAGFDIEIAEMVAGALFPDAADPGAHIEFVEALSKDREQYLQDGTVDLVISTYTISDARKLIVDFAGPYYIAGQDILARRTDIGSGAISGVADLNGRRVCAVTGSTSLANLKAAAPEADTSVTKERYPDCFRALQAGQVDAMTTDDVILLGLAQSDPGRFQITGNPFHSEPYGIGIPKGDTELRALLNDELQRAFDDGRWAAAFERTVGTVSRAVPSPPTLDE